MKQPLPAPISTGQVAAAPALWYFDIISPFAYLAFDRLAEIEAKRPVRLKPIVFAGLLKHWGQLGPAEIAPKRVQIYRQCHFLASRRGLPFVLPPRHPFSPLAIMRLLTVLDGNRAAVGQAFRAVWGEGRDPDAADVLAEIAAAAGDPAAVNRIADPAIKQQLSAEGMQAITVGVYGVPTLVIDGETFWGYDAIDMALAFLDDPALFTGGGIERAASLPVGAVRETQPGKRP